MSDLPPRRPDESDGATGQLAPALSSPFVHHGGRWLLAAALAIWVGVLFPAAPHGGSGLDFAGWDVAPQDVVARVEFEVRKTPAEFERERRAAMAGVAPTFDLVPSARDSTHARLREAFERLDSLVRASGRQGLVALAEDLDVQNPEALALDILDGERRDALDEAARRALSEIAPEGLVEADHVAAVQAGHIVVRDDAGREVVRDTDELVTAPRFLERAQLALPPETSTATRQFFRAFVAANLDYSLRLNAIATERDRNEASGAISAVHESFLTDQVIVRAGDPVGEEARRRLRAHEDALARAGPRDADGRGIGGFFGRSVVLMVLIAVFGTFLYATEREIYENFRWLLLLAFLAAFYFGVAFLIDAAELGGEWLPMVFVIFPVAVLWDARVALVLASVLVVATGTLPPFASSYSTLLALFATGAPAALCAIVVTRRSRVWIAMAILSAVGSAVVLTDSLAGPATFSESAARALWLAMNVGISMLLGLGLLFVYELFTGITTPQTLTEWSDAARPLLRRLSLTAPGTYAHSMVVATLAEAAAERIGSNGLLARVGAYYHDVGKALRPQYFIENQTSGHNPHDSTPPELSARILREHVTEGERLAREAKLPAILLPFVREHHGTQTIAYFLDKARKAVGERQGDVDESLFRYPGPRPRSKETAIVMCADSCESAVRAMRFPTPEKIRALVDGIIARKVTDGQLARAPITLEEVESMKTEFVRVLAGTTHRRIDYPDTKHLTATQDGDGDGEE